MPQLQTSDGRTLAWHERGSGPPLILHPGGPGCSSAYFGELPELEAERTLMLLDPRGTGDSDRPADPSAYELEDYAADVEALREHLGLDRIDLLGHSHGGFVAMTWAGNHPERVGRLILSNTAARFTDQIRAHRMARIESHRGQPYFEDALEALDAHREGRYSSDEELTDLFRRDWVLQLAPEVDADPIIEGLTRAGNNADALRHFNEVVSNAMDQRPVLRRIESPTLVITGELDSFGPVPAREIADALPDPTVVVLPGADHFIFLQPEHRPAWSRAVLDFLGS
jgi:pimeloyl-ACP methyl ester carboxylesterase